MPTYASPWAWGRVRWPCRHPACRPRWTWRRRGWPARSAVWARRPIDAAVPGFGRPRSRKQRLHARPGRRLLLTTSGCPRPSEVRSPRAAHNDVLAESTIRRYEADGTHAIARIPVPIFSLVDPPFRAYEVHKEAEGAHPSSISIGKADPPKRRRSENKIKRGAGFPISVGREGRERPPPLELAPPSRVFLSFPSTLLSVSQDLLVPFSSLLRRTPLSTRLPLENVDIVGPTVTCAGVSILSGTWPSTPP